MIKIKIIYNKENGSIYNAIGNTQDYRVYFLDMGEDFIDTLDYLIVEQLPNPLEYYYVDLEVKNIKRYDDNIIEEINKYGKILTEEEREELENSPKQPTVDELQEQIKELNMIVDTMLGVDIE